MDEQAIFSKITAIIADQTGDDASKMTLATDLKNDLTADSLDIFEVINQIEDEYDLQIEAEEQLQTIGDLVKFVAAHAKNTEGE